MSRPCRSLRAFSRAVARKAQKLYELAIYIMPGASVLGTLVLFAELPT